MSALSSITSPFVKQVANVIDQFQKETFTKSRIVVSIPDEREANAIGHLFKISMPKNEKFVFSFENREVGIIHSSADGIVQIDTLFMETLKTSLQYHTSRLASPWKDASDDDLTREFYEIAEGIPLYMRISEEGSKALYEILNWESGNRVSMDGFHADIMFGQQSEIKEFLDYLRKVEKEFAQVLVPKNYTAPA